MMKNLKRALAISLLLVVLGGAVTPGIAFMQPAEAVADEVGNSPARADIIGWRYMTAENGQMLRRLYNYSWGVWIGEWEPC